MDIKRNKIILYILIIATGIDVTLPWPVRRQKVPKNLELSPKQPENSRVPRQVVQPKWLNINYEPVIDPTVYVNPKALEEAAMIRKTIQQSVQDDTYAVTGEEPNPILPPIGPPNFPTIFPPIFKPILPPMDSQQPLPSFKPIFPPMDSQQPLPGFKPIFPPMDPQQPFPMFKPIFPPMEGQPHFPSFVPEDDENSPHDLPPWYLRMQRLWQSWSQGLFKGLRPQNES